MNENTKNFINHLIQHHSAATSDIEHSLITLKSIKGCLLSIQKNKDNSSLFVDLEGVLNRLTMSIEQMEYNNKNNNI